MMRPKMLRALSDAEAENNNGLEYTVGGVPGYHSFQTINALVERGYLKFWNKRERAHITDHGQRALDDERETLRDRAERERRKARR